MIRYSRQEAAERAGVEEDYLARLAELGILIPDTAYSFSQGDVRRVMMARSLEGAGISLEEVVAAIDHGALSLDFADSFGFERLTGFAAETFRQVSNRTGIPLELLMVVREAIGMPQPEPDDPLLEHEMNLVPFIEKQIYLGFRPPAIERFLRVIGDSTRRIAEQEAAWWNTEVIEQANVASKGPAALWDDDVTRQIAPLTDRALLTMYHAHQARNWTSNLIEGFEVMMEKVGIRSRLERLPAMCFLDITGYTRLTQERGDDAAAELATTVARLVERISFRHGGKPVKWLGDGVMFYFEIPGHGVRAALEMVEDLSAASGFPPVHVGIHSGPVLYQEGDLYGQTVNLSARIADYARANEVLVTQAVVDASQEDGIAFNDLGEVELKGVSGTVRLLRAYRSHDDPSSEERRMGTG